MGTTGPAAYRPSKSEHDPFGVGQIAKTWSFRPAEKFWRVVEIPAGQVQKWPVRVDLYEEQAPPRQKASEDSSEPREILHLSAISELRVRQAPKHLGRQEDERKATIGRRAQEAYAAIASVFQQQSRFPLRERGTDFVDQRHRAGGVGSTDRRYCDKAAIAVAAVAKRIQHRPCARLRRDVDIGCLSMAPCMCSEHRTVAAECRVSVPTRHRAADGRTGVADHAREDKKD